MGRTFRVGAVWENTRGTLHTVVDVTGMITTLRKGTNMARGRKVRMGLKAPDGWRFVAPHPTGDMGR